MLVLSEKKMRIVSGMRTSGLLHLGNFVGALSNWVALQQQYDCYFFAANFHGLTTDYADPTNLMRYTREMIIDWLAAGLDPNKSVLFVQSDVPQHSELHLLFSMITPLAWLERVPTYKDRLREQSTRELSTYGFLGYPVLQAADILLYEGDAVPVGEDQLPHLELTREIARRFNAFYGPVLPEPKGLLTRFPMLPGIDGRKMSKSYDNAILLSHSADEIRKRVSMMITDPARIRKDDPGHPEVCTVFTFHKVFNAAEADEIEAACKAGQIGCVQCKKNLAAILVETLKSHHHKRDELTKNTGYVDDVIRDGAVKARAEARRVLARVRDAMKII